MTDDSSTTDWDVPAYDTAVMSRRANAHAVVIPVINEGDRIRRQLTTLASHTLPVDVIIADGGSTDGSLATEFLSDVSVRCLLTKRGPGRLSAQLRMAYSWCLTEGYEGVVTVDGNGKDSVRDISVFVERLVSGYDYVQGSRYLPGGVAVNTPLDRALGNRLIHAPLLSVAGRYMYTDTTNGYRGYSRRFLLDPKVAPFRAVFIEYELLFYLTVRAGQLGYRVCEIPVSRSYPIKGRVPTKIAGFSGRWHILKQTMKAALGFYHPRQSPNHLSS
jgi:dolichol-phosphate mannosyltransferase